MKSLYSRNYVEGNYKNGLLTKHNKMNKLSLYREGTFKEKYKYISFQYFTKLLEKWERDVCPEMDDVNPIKAHNLLLFSVHYYHELLDLFDEFVTHSFGHIEHDVYRYSVKIKDNEKHFNTLNDIKLENETKKSLENSINTLKTKHKDIISFRTFDIVEMSHKLDSWILYFKPNQKETIPKEIIKYQRFDLIP